MREEEIQAHILLCQTILVQLENEIQDIKARFPVENSHRWIRLLLITKRIISDKAMIEDLKQL